MERKSEATLRPIRKNDKKCTANARQGLLCSLAKLFHSLSCWHGLPKHRPTITPTKLTQKLQGLCDIGQLPSTQCCSSAREKEKAIQQIVTNTCTRVWCCNGFDVVSIAASMSQPRCQGRNEEAKDRHRGMSFRNLKRQEKESAKRSSGLFFFNQELSGQQTQYNGTNKHQTLSIVWVMLFSFEVVPCIFRESCQDSCTWNRGGQ